MSQFFPFPPVMMPLRQYTLAQAMAISAASLPPGTPVVITDYGRTIAITDGVRWRLERLYLAWAGLPAPSLVPVGTEASITDCGGAIAVAGVAGWVFRPITLSSNTKITLTGTTSKTALASVTIPANTLGNNGFIYVDYDFTCTGSTNAKVIFAELGVVLDLTGGYTVSALSAVTGRRSAKARCRNKTALECVPSWSFDGTSSVNALRTLDMSLDRQLVISAQLALATESFNLEGFSVVIQPAM